MVNAVIATDIADKELKQDRQKRWDAAFSEHAVDSSTMDDDCRATITFEYIIQASDICHTMQVSAMLSSRHIFFCVPAASLAKYLLLVPSTTALADKKSDFSICWSIYVGWMPWDYGEQNGIIKKWAENEIL